MAGNIKQWKVRKKCWDMSGVGLCNLLSALKSIWDFKGACDKTTGHTSRVRKNQLHLPEKCGQHSLEDIANANMP